MRKLFFTLLALLLPSQSLAHSNPLLLMNVETGEVIVEQGAGESWYPASLTKMMTAYTVLYAVKQGRLTLDHPIHVSQQATRQAPSKMGFKVGSLITVENALKIIMVKSANDVSYTLAEGVSGSLINFVQEMNGHASRLGLNGTRFINANGLPGRGQATTARDMAMLGRALLLEFPEQAALFDIPALTFGQKTMRNTNHLLGRYPNVTGIKTGFICASGFNVVASVAKGGRYYIAVVLGAQSARERANLAAELFEKASTRGAGKTVLAIQNTGGSPPDLRQEICKRRAKGAPVVADTGEDFELEAMRSLEGVEPTPRQEKPMVAALLSTYSPSRAPEPVSLGQKPGMSYPILGAAGAKLAVAKEKPVVASKPVVVAKPVTTTKLAIAKETPQPKTKLVQAAKKPLDAKEPTLKGKVVNGKIINAKVTPVAAKALPKPKKPPPAKRLKDEEE